LKKDYNSSGIFTFTGYYPEFNVLLSDLPEYGFASDAVVSTSGEAELKQYFAEGVIAAGFQFLIANKIQLSLGASYAKTLTDIADYSDPDNFHLTEDKESIRSVLGGSYSSVLESMRFGISARYFFKGYRSKSVPPQEQ
jgi:hypothetical protein